MNSDEQPVLSRELQPALAARFYSSPSVFALERERLFHAQWFCVGRAEQVPARGDCLHVHVAGESVLILRQEDDSLRAFYNVCRHRGSRLVRTPPLPDPDQPSATCSTSMSSGVVCPYHAWTYNLDGSLRAARYVQFDSTCPKEGFSLVPVHLDTWGGFIFVNLATTPAQSLHEQIAVPVRNLQRYPLQRSASWRAAHLRRARQLESAHGELQRVLSLRAGASGAVRARSGLPRARRRRPRLGRRHSASRRCLDFHAQRLIEPRAISRAVGQGEDPSQGRSRVSEPAAECRSGARRGVHALAHGPDHTRIACEFLFHPDEIAKADFDPADVVEFWDVVNKQDWQICESVQDGMRSRGFRGGFYAPMEDPSLDIRRYLERHLGDLSQVS